MPPIKLAAGDFGAEVARVHEALAKHGLDVAPDEQKRSFFGPTTREAVKKFQTAHGVDPTSEVSGSTAAMLASALTLTAAVPQPGRTPPPSSTSTLARSIDPGALVGIVPNLTTPSAATNGGGPAGAASARVSGVIALEHGSPASQVRVRLYQRAFGGSKTLLSETETDQQGGYAIPYSSNGAANIEVFAVGADGTEVQLSQTTFGAQTEERIDLIAPNAVQPALAEFARLKAAIAPSTGGNPAALKDAVERPGRRDFTFLAGATGWDSAALALASEAFSVESRTKIPAEGAYAMARAGLPTDVRILANVSRQSVATALRQASEAGIVDATAVEKSMKAFVEFATEYRFTNSIRGATSSPADFVAKARISDADRAAFAAVVRDENPDNLWVRAQVAGVSETGIQKLQLQGKIAYLTFNNAELSHYLTNKLTADPAELIDLGFYDSSKWEQTLRELGGTDVGKLALLVPPVFSAGTLDQRLAAYTMELARRVRQMDPHAVTVCRIASGAIGGVAEREAVSQFLKNASPLGFRLGKTPLGNFVASNSDSVWAGIAGEKHDAVMNSVRTLSSLYSTSPNDDILGALLMAGFGSATAIARTDRESFSRRIQMHLPVGPKAGDTTSTDLVFWKAQQQSATVFNVFNGLKRLGSIPHAAGSGPGDARHRDDQVEAVRQKMAGLFPTMETLFGSVDYCECSDCQSVLSPAAYLVDVLHFLDPDEDAWATVKGSFEARAGFPYGKRKPFDVLNDRRPDIKNISLTCANTNTALPYVDIVNEVLEQLMMSEQTPPAIEAYDVGDSSSQDLIAEPQNILWSAYVGAPGKPGLRDLVSPITLPFDLPLEMVRAFLKQLDLPLWRLRERLARPKALDPSALGRTDGWTDVWFERLGLGARDVAVLTQSDKWYELFGYESAAGALETITLNGVALPAERSLRNGKTLARRLDVTYVELVELLRTRFINPFIENLIALKRLGIDPSIVDRHLGDGPPLSSGERTELEAGLLAHGVKIDELASLRSDAARKATLELRSPNVGCDFAKITLDFDKGPENVDEATAFVMLRMNAFVRLQKKLGWDVHELDRLIMAVMPGAATATMATWADAMKSALIYLGHVEELRERLEDRLSREEIVILWSDIPTTGMACFYDRLFSSQGAAARDPVFTKRLGRVLEDKTILLGDHVDGIRQALQLSHDEIELILKAAGVSDRSLSIENLSVLMRYAVFARGLGIPVAALLSFASVSEHKPLSPFNGSALRDMANDVPWSETLGFVREVEVVGEAGVDVAFLERICRHRGVEEQPPADKDPVLIALASLPLAETTTPEKHQTLVVQTLAAQLSAPDSIVDTLLGRLLKDSTNTPLKLKGFQDAATAAFSVRKLRKALDLFQSLSITQDEISHLTSVPSALDPNDLPVDEAQADGTASATRKALNPWLELAAARRVFGRSERLIAVMSAARQPIDATNTLVSRETHLVSAMSALTGIKPAALASSLDAIGAKSIGGTTFDVPALSTLSALRETIDALKCFTRLGLNPNDVVQFASTSIDDTVARRLRSSVKGRYTTSAWRRVAKPIFDELRKKQRDALVAHLTHQMIGETPKYGDTLERLFEYLLLDPGTEPVVVASRIQLAIASVQLFVQRCLMNLESAGVDPQIIDTKRWEWMHRYRVWEVNRKMFIWPENWLDPEFRDDKTHLFRNLESKLLQADVNDDSVRTCLQDYLKGLEEIARLEMLTMYFEPGASADGAIIHVVGRTPNAPHKYFYRASSHGMWTPWEPIDVGIEGRHLVLTAWRGRMHLFWVSFLQQSEENANIPKTFAPGTVPVATDSLRGVSKVKLQLHWVERVHGLWVNRNSTPNFLDTKFAGCKATTDEEKQLFFVRAVVVENGAGIEDEDLEIQVTHVTQEILLAHKFTFFSKLAPPRSEMSGSKPSKPPFDVSASATKWEGTGALRVRFMSAVVESAETKPVRSGDFYHTVLGGGGGFSLLFPSNQSLPVPARTPPSGVGKPTGYVSRTQNAQHVAYRTGNGSICDLLWTTDGWFYQSPSQDAADLGASEGTEPANSDPHGYAVDDRGTICIAYSGATKVHELVWSQLDSSLDDSQLMDTGWRIETLYEGSIAADRPQGRPFGGLFLPSRGSVFRTKDGRLRAAVEASNGGPFEMRDLNTSLPRAASDPTGLLMTKTDLGIMSVVSRHVFYLGEDGNVHELRSDSDGTTWTYTNITQGIAGIIKPAPGSTPAVYAFLGQGTLHVVYRGTDDRIHELWGTSGSWNYNPIGARFAKAKGDPAGYVTETSSMQHVVYRGDGDEVVELWWAGIWREKILTKATGASPRARSDVAGYAFEPNGTQHVVYFAEDGSLRELGWRQGGWRAGAYELENPFLDDLGPLAAPFFYESTSKDHAFFVEPFVVETAVHEWKNWIVTTKEYVEVQPNTDALVPINPLAIAVVPSVVGIIKETRRVKQRIFDDNVVIKISKGTIAPAVRMDGAMTSPGAASMNRAAVIMDVGRGNRIAPVLQRTGVRLGGSQ